MATSASSTVVKAFNVLELFTVYSVLGAADCARLLDMPRASAHRMLVSLRDAGAIEATKGGRYRLAMKVFEIGARVPQHRWLHEAAYLPMEKLAAGTGLTVQLAVRDGLELVYMIKLRHRPDRTRCQVGQRNHLHATAIGKVLLAHAPEEVVQAVIERGLKAFTPRTIVTDEALREELRAVRGQGFALDREERSKGIVSVAVPIRGAQQDDLPASIAVLAHTEMFGYELARLREALQPVQDEIERRLLPTVQARDGGIRFDHPEYLQALA